MVLTEDRAVARSSNPGREARGARPRRSARADACGAPVLTDRRTRRRARRPAARIRAGIASARSRRRRARRRAVQHGVRRRLLVRRLVGHITSAGLDAGARGVATGGTDVGRRVPALAPGVEVVGRYRGSGYKERRFLVRRPDGQWLQLTPLLYRVAAAIDGMRSSADIATTVGLQIEREVSAENVELLLEKLTELGLFASDEVTAKPDLMLGMRVRRPWIPARVVRPVARCLAPFFRMPLVVLVVAGFVLADVRLLSSDRVLQATGHVLGHPEEGLAVIGLILLGAVFHELGHASACTYGGARPGEIGGGFYLLWPAMYTNVTDSYRLRREGRVRTDLGGVYFNAIFVVAVADAYYLTGYSALPIVLVMTNLMILEQFLPFVRFDGYWALSDLAGVPDLFPRLAAALGRLVPFRRPSPLLEELKPMSRRVIVVWAAVTAIVLPAQFVLMLVLVPSVAVSTWFAIPERVEAIAAALQAHHLAAVLLGIVQLVLVTLFFVGLIYAVSFLSFRVVRGAVRRGGGSAVRRTLIAITVSCAVLVPVVWSASHVQLASPN